MASPRSSILISFLVCASSLWSQEDATRKDSLSHDLKEVTVALANKNLISDLGSGSIRWNLEELNGLPKILGNADPLHYAQMLPGIQVNNEYDCGVHIYGCDNGHNSVSAGGVTIYNASHFLGFFSTFNASHYSGMVIHKTATDAFFPNRLGGSIDMTLHRTVKDSVKGEFSVGLMSSQASVHIPLGKKNMLSISARGCYINLLYGWALKEEDAKTAYDFWDTNLTWLCTPSEKDKIWVDAYFGGDKLRLTDYGYMSELNLKWSNMMAGVHWEHLMGTDSKIYQKIYGTGYDNHLSLNHFSQKINVPNSIYDLGYDGYYQWKWLKAGLQATWHNITPQYPILEGLNIETQEGKHTFSTQEYAAIFNAEIPLGTYFALDGGLRGNLYVDDDKYCHFSPDPSLQVRFNKKTWSASLSASYRHQYLFQTGFSSTSLPTDFWLSCSKQIPPQHGLSLLGSVSKRLFNDNWKLSLELYYKRLFNQVEYRGDLLDYITTIYDFNDHLLQGDGHNYGFNITLAKTKGKVIGWVNYNYGRALRNFEENNIVSQYPARHERIHELSALATYNISPHWDVGSTFVFASGTPFTCVKSMYLYSNTVVAEYSDHNACRLAPYLRLDISANYKFRIKKKYDSGVNLSIYNVTARRNQILWYYRYDTDDNFVKYQPMSFIVSALPSISFYMKF